MPRATQRLNRRSSREAIDEAISSCIETVMREWKETGRIGNSRPETEEEARKQAAGLCYGEARRQAGATKVPRR